MITAIIGFLILFGMLEWSLYTIEGTLKSIELRLMDFNGADLSGVERRLSEIERATDNISDKVEKIVNILEEKEFLGE